MRQKHRKSNICACEASYVKLKVENKKTAIHAVREPVGALRKTLRTQVDNDGEGDSGTRDLPAPCRVSAAPVIAKYKEGENMEEEKSFGEAPDLGSALRFAAGERPKRHLEIDVARYQEYLDDPSLSEGQKTEIVEALWTIMMAFVDLGFGLHPMQQVCEQEACGKHGQSLDGKREKDSNGPEPRHETLCGNFNGESLDI